MTRAQEHDADIHNASTMNDQRQESRRRPLPRSASMTDARPNGEDVVGALLDEGPSAIIADYTAPTTGLRGHLDELRRSDAGRVAPGVHPDIDDHTSCASCTTATAEPGEVQLDVTGDERLAPGGAAEEHWNQTSARHREGGWPRQPLTYDRVELR